MANRPGVAIDSKIYIVLKINNRLIKKPIVHKKNQTEEKRTISLLKVLEFLALHPNDSFSLTEVSRQAKLSKAMASRMVKELVRERFVLLKTIANVWRIQFNGGDLATRGYKISMNLRMIYASMIVDELIEVFGTPKSIILFGSVRKGEDQPGSDIDIAVEILTTKETTILDGDEIYKRIPSLKLFERRFERRLRLHIFSKETVDKNLFLNIANGIVLYGFLEVKP